MVEIKKRIKNLEKFEFNCISSIDTKLKTHLSLMNNTEEFIQFIQLADSSGNKSLFENNISSSYWANAVDKVPVSHQFLHTNNLILDLKPNLNSNDDFIKEYGLSVFQILKLASLKKLCINLYAYDSSKLTEFKAYANFKGTKQEINAYLDLFLPENNCRINAIRRRYYFEQSLKYYNLKYVDFFEEGKSKFAFLLKLENSAIEQLIKRKLIRNVNNSHELLEMMATQFASNKSFAAIEPKDPDIQSLQTTVDNTQFSTQNYVDCLTTMRACKIIISSVRTASMGGIYNMSYSSLSSLVNARRILDKNDLMTSLINSTKDQHEFLLANKMILEHLQEYLFRKSSSKHNILIPSQLNNKEFNNFLDYCQDHANIVHKQAECINKLSKNPDFDEKRLSNLQTYLDCQEDVLKGYKTLKKVLDVTTDKGLEIAALVGLGYVISPGPLTMIGFGASIFGKLIFSNNFSEKISKAIYGGKYQLMCDIKELKSIIGRHNE